MKILHIIDPAYFQTHKKTISELILSLSLSNVEQKVYTEEGVSFGWVDTVCEVIGWKISKSGKFKKFANKLKTWFLFSSFRPDIVIKYGLKARIVANGVGGVQVSFLNEKENLSTFEDTDYIMTNVDDVLSYVKSHGYSGARSFLLPSFVYEYPNIPDIIKKDYFIPEKSDVVYVGGTFLRNIGFEWAFEALSVVQNSYFFIVGSGPEDEYVKDCALRVNLKARSRFIPEIEKTMKALADVKFAFVPFDDPELSKYILEAMLQRKLVITVKNSQSEEFVSDGKTGFFVPKTDMYLIKKKLKEVMALPEEEKEKIINNAFEYAKNYTAPIVIPAYLKMFEELIRKYNSRKNLLNN